MVKSMWRRALAALAAACMVLAAAVMLCPVQAQGAPSDQATSSVSAPRVVEDANMSAGQKATWDCVWFGSYPQKVVIDPATIAALDAADWSGGRATLGGVEYARLYPEDATHSGYFERFETCHGAGGCLYFACSPIKWRVLETDGSTALLLADSALDAQRYHGIREEVTWEGSDLRAWLNSSFMDAAFTPAEKAAIVRQDLENEDNDEYGTEGGNATQDDVFLLSLSDVYGEGGAAHGFATSPSASDEARCARVSDYAHAMGESRSTYHDSQPGSGWWWLRSPGVGAHCASLVHHDGYVYRSGYGVDGDSVVVRPALRISLSSNLISSAGTVDSGGTDVCLYFACSPIKWRVLEADGSTALLLADSALDAQRYHGTNTDVTWEGSDLRTWLNSGFMDAAFTPAEKAAIVRQDLENADNEACGTEGGTATQDDVFLLSLSDVYGEGGAAHGFATSPSASDEARCARVSDYAHAMGGSRYTVHDSQPGSGWWWLRSPGRDAYYASHVDYGGYVSRRGSHVDSVNDVVRPALRIPLSSNQISSAGTVDSDGTAAEAQGGAPSSVAAPRVAEDANMSTGQKATWDCVWFGSYPQRLVRDASTIAALDVASWEGGRATVDGVEYVRLYPQDATSSSYFADSAPWYGNDGSAPAPEPSPDPADKQALEASEAAAGAADDGVASSADGKDVKRNAQWVPADVAKRLADAAAAASKVLADAGATQEEVDAAKKALGEALAAYEAAKKPGTAPAAWTRLAGGNALGTMADIVGAGFSECDAVVVASLDGYWDALSASSLAGALGCPVLLTGTDSLSAEAAAEITRLGATTAYVVGGTYWIPDSQLAELEALGAKPVRVAGPNAQDTAIEAAKQAAALAEGGLSKTCLVATSGTFQDALCAGPFAYARKAPIYLAAEDGTLSQATLADIKARGFERAIVVGGSYWIPDATLAVLRGAGVATVERKSGATAYDTSAVFAEWALGQGMSVETLGIATSGTHHDALTGAAFCGSRNGVLVLADDASDSNVGGFIKSHGKQVVDGFAFGGTYWIADTVIGSCEKATE